MTDNKVLGRGLAALIGSDKQKEVIDLTVDSSYQYLDISKISSNPFQPRTVFDEDLLAGLAESIKSSGLVQPIIVRRSGGGYELIAGERRWRASKLAGLTEIPAIIREADDAESLEMALIENISREDLNPIDTARAYVNLQEDFHITQEQLAEKLGRSRSAVANTIRLLDLPDEIQNLIVAGKLSEGHGRALLAIDDRLQQKKIASKIVQRALSVRQAEALVKKDDSKKTREPETLGPSVNQELMDEATDALYSAFRLPVKVRWSAKCGKIEMEFKDENQLNQLIDILEMH